jgi:hypothetical protein
MNFNFISPLFLFGVIGITVPVLIHLMTRRQKKHQYFSAVHLLLQSKNQSIKQSRPNRKFLLLIRCLGIALLSLAMANPIFLIGGSNNLGANGPSATVFILDDSYSMGTQTNQKSYYNQAVKTLLNISNSLPKKSIYSVVLGSSPSRVLQNWTTVPEKAKNILKLSQPTSRTTEIGAAIKKSLLLLEEVPQKNKIIYILTDRDENGWNEEEFSSIGEIKPHRFFIIDFSEMRDGVNKAVIEHAEVQQKFLSNNRVIKVKVKTANLSQSKPISKLKVSLWVNDKEQTQETLDIPVNSSIEKEFSFLMENNNLINGKIRIEDDSLLKDNLRFFSYQPGQTIKTLIVDGDPNAIEHRGETFYLERALNPFTSSLSNIQLTVSTLAELPKRNLLDYSVIIICNAHNLPFGYEQKLEKFVLRGGALFITLGNQVNAKFYNERLGNILPVFLKAINQTQKNDEPFRLLVKPSKHPVLKIFKKQTLEEMKTIEFQSIYTIERREGYEFTTPIALSNNLPALIESTAGKGKVVLFLSSIDRDWNNFPIQPTFLPWIQRWVKYSAHGLDSLTQKNLLVGEPFDWENAPKGNKNYVVTPGGKVIATPYKNGKIIFKNTFTPGIYKLYQSTRVSSSKSNITIPSRLPFGVEPAGAFTVNINPIESSSIKISNEKIRSLLPKANLVFSSVNQELNLTKTNKSILLFTYFMILLGAVLLFEGWLVRNE